MPAAPQVARAGATKVKNAFATTARDGTNGHERIAPVMKVRLRASAVMIEANGNQIRPVARTASARNVVHGVKMVPAASVARSKHPIPHLLSEDLSPGHLTPATSRSTRSSQSPGITRSKRSRASTARYVPNHAVRCTVARIVAQTGHHANHGYNGIPGTCGSHVKLESHASHVMFAKTAHNGNGCL